MNGRHSSTWLTITSSPRTVRKAFFFVPRFLARIYGINQSVYVKRAGIVSKITISIVKNRWSSWNKGTQSRNSSTTSSPRYWHTSAVRIRDFWAFTVANSTRSIDSICGTNRFIASQNLKSDHCLARFLKASWKRSTEAADSHQRWGPMHCLVTTDNKADGKGLPLWKQKKFTSVFQTSTLFASNSSTRLWTQSAFNLWPQPTVR